jgi:hypothetical protein
MPQDRKGVGPATDYFALGIDRRADASLATAMRCSASSEVDPTFHPTPRQAGGPPLRQDAEAREMARACYTGLVEDPS